MSGPSIDRTRLATAALNGAAPMVPPHNEEAEASVLGAILLTEQALPAVIEAGLRPEHFYRPRHGRIFRAMLMLTRDGEPVDALTVCEQLRGEGQLDEAGGEAYVHSLPTVVPAVGAVQHYSEIVREKALARQMTECLRDWQAELYAGRPPRDLLRRATAELLRLDAPGASGPVRLDELLHELIDELEERSRAGGGLRGLPSGFPDLDEITGGFRDGDLAVLAARPAMGKTQLALNIATHVAQAREQRRRGVLVFTLEMSRHAAAQRMLAAEARVDGTKLDRARLGNEDWKRLLAGAEQLAGAPIYVDHSATTVTEARAKTERLINRIPDGLALVVVDYLQLIDPERRGQSRTEDVSEINRGLKRLAQDLELPVLALSQLNRQVEQREDKRPRLADLRESGQIEADAAQVLFLYRDDYYNSDSDRRGEVEVDVAKNRHGATGAVPLTFQARYPTFMSHFPEAAGG